MKSENMEISRLRARLLKKNKKVLHKRRQHEIDAFEKRSVRARNIKRKYHDLFTRVFCQVKDSFDHKDDGYTHFLEQYAKAYCSAYTSILPYYHGISRKANIHELDKAYRNAVKHDLFKYISGHIKRFRANPTNIYKHSFITDNTYVRLALDSAYKLSYRKLRKNLIYMAVKSSDYAVRFASATDTPADRRFFNDYISKANPACCEEMNYTSLKNAVVLAYTKNTADENKRKRFFVLPSLQRIGKGTIGKTAVFAADSPPTSMLNVYDSNTDLHPSDNTYAQSDSNLPSAPNPRRYAPYALLPLTAILIYMLTSSDILPSIDASAIKQTADNSLSALVAAANENTKNTEEQLQRQNEAQNPPQSGNTVTYPDFEQYSVMLYENQSTHQNEEQGSQQTGGQGSPPAEGQGSPQARGQGSQQTEGQGSPQTEGQGSPQTEGQGSPQTEGQGSPQVDGQSSPQTEGQGSPQADGQGSPQNEGQGSPQNEGQGSPQAEEPNSPQNEGQGSPQNEGQGSPQADGQGSPQNGGPNSPQNDPQTETNTDNNDANMPDSMPNELPSSNSSLPDINTPQKSVSTPINPSFSPIVSYPQLKTPAQSAANQKLGSRDRTGNYKTNPKTGYEHP